MNIVALALLFLLNPVIALAEELRPDFARNGTCSSAHRFCSAYCQKNPKECIYGDP
jgi:hypothetical protein